MDSGPTIRTILCDDHPVVRDGLRKNLEKQPDVHVVAEAGDGEEAISLFFAVCPDVALVDLRMPRKDGVEVIREIVARDPSARLVVLTQFETDADVLRAIEAGAIGYLLKSAPVEDLVLALRSAAAGGSPLDPAAARRLTKRHGPDGATMMTPREMEVLEALARGLTSNKEITRELNIAEGTLKKHLDVVNRKLGTRDRTGALVEALRRGVIGLDP